MNSLLVLCGLLGIALSANDEKWRFMKREYTLEEALNVDTMELFKVWADAFDKSYDTLVDEAHHYTNFLTNLMNIGETNSLKLEYTLGLNQFSDLNEEEFKAYVHGENGACYIQTEMPIINSESFISEIDIPFASSVDWRTKGVVTPVKNQGQCGSCWAFSTTGAEECDAAIASGKLNSLSEQELVDCDTYSNGCGGGDMGTAMKWTQQNGGLCSESEYRYTGRDGSCKKSSCGTKYDHNSGHHAVTPDSSSAMVSAVNGGCVSIAVDASGSFSQYSGGVLTRSCGTSLDHGVLIVGYGTSGSTQYWIVKNSWGQSWGESGYIKLVKGTNANGGSGQCGCLMDGNTATY